MGARKPERLCPCTSHCGTAADEAGEELYRFATGAGSGCPIVVSKKTGKWAVWSWQELIEAAIAAGLDEP